MAGKRPAGRREILQSKPFLSDAQRHRGARRLGKAIASLDQCIEFALNVDDEMTRWATDFEQLWDAARKLFSSIPYSPAGASLMDAVEVFEHCRQRYESDYRYPTEPSIEAMRVLVDQLQMIVDGKSMPVLPPLTQEVASSSEWQAAPAAGVPPRNHFASSKDRQDAPTGATDDSQSPARNIPGPDQFCSG